MQKTREQNRGNKIKRLCKQSECRQISAGYDSKPWVNITRNGFERVFQTGEAGNGLKKNDYNCPL